ICCAIVDDDEIADGVHDGYAVFINRHWCGRRRGSRCRGLRCSSACESQNQTEANHETHSLSSPECSKLVCLTDLAGLRRVKKRKTVGPPQRWRGLDERAAAHE